MESKNVSYKTYVKDEMIRNRKLGIFVFIRISYAGDRGGGGVGRRPKKGLFESAGLLGAAPYS